MEYVIQIQVEQVQQACKGDEKAIEQLYRQYANGMYHICLRMCADSELAKDIFHEAFIKAIGKLTQLRVDEQFGGWLKRIVINECLKQMKQSKLFVDFKESSLEVPDEGTEWFAEINIQHVNEEVQKLPEGCRQVFVMYAMEDYSHKEVAEALHISESTSKSQYQRARVLLKERLLKRS